MSRGILASIYVPVNAVFSKLHTGARAVFEGFWLGLLTDRAVDQIGQFSYEPGEAYATTGHLDMGLHFWEEPAIQKFPSRGRVIVAAAGAGREIIALSRRGYQAEGFDCSRVMVAAGQRALRERGIDAQLRWAPPSSVPELQGIFDAAVIGWNGYTHIVPRAHRITFLKSIRTALRDGAPLLVSCAIRYGSGKWTPRIANLIRVLTLRRAEFDDGVTFPGRPKHLFVRRQLEAELIDAGFVPASFWKWGGYGAALCYAGERGSPAVTLAGAAANTQAAENPS